MMSDDGSSWHSLSKVMGLMPVGTLRVRGISWMMDAMMDDG